MYNRASCSSAFSIGCIVDVARVVSDVKINSGQLLIWLLLLLLLQETLYEFGLSHQSNLSTVGKPERLYDNSQLASSFSHQKRRNWRQQQLEEWEWQKLELLLTWLSQSTILKWIHKRLIVVGSKLVVSGDSIKLGNILCHSNSWDNLLKVPVTAIKKHCMIHTTECLVIMISLLVLVCRWGKQFSIAAHSLIMDCIIVGWG